MTKPPQSTPDTPADVPPLDPAEFQTQLIPLSKIRRYHNNPRKNDHAVKKTAASIQEFGWRQPLVLDADGVIIAGDTRFLAAEALGYPAAPCWIVPEGRLTAEQIKAYRLADNRTHDEADWNMSALSAEISELLEADYDLAQTAFDRKELDQLLEGKDDGALETINVRPAPRNAWVLIGIDVARYIEIADEIEKISKIDGIFCEIAANDQPIEEPLKTSKK